MKYFENFFKFFFLKKFSVFYVIILNKINFPVNFYNIPQPHLSH